MAWRAGKGRVEGVGGGREKEDRGKESNSSSSSSVSRGVTAVVERSVEEKEGGSDANKGSMCDSEMPAHARTNHSIHYTTAHPTTHPWLML